ncbi:hypothetical protein PTTG_28730 [Puccinia triticina 1-1 BBBD Race 1]|uniref:Uncharacterized protein n=1 Tax=Puccinia triticina (isolate 1-1 / race 1 (BBBD)) TaxID=630390 RepID=A0A180GBN2_PUCT1|nr:hypothetical protein PTTG_28730 [Puccinia triticina 1-1 BBBD Race 1]
MEITPEDQEILNLVNLLNKQFDMHVRAWEVQNTRALRRLLSQAATTQEMMEDIVGREEAIRLSQHWIPREDLNALERKLYHQNLDAERRAPPITTAQTSTNLALSPHPGHQPLVATPTPEPQTSQHQAPETGSSNAASAPSATTENGETPTSFYTARWDPSAAPSSLPAPQRALKSTSTPLSTVGRSARELPASVPFSRLERIREELEPAHGKHPQDYQRRGVLDEVDQIQWERPR